MSDFYIKDYLKVVVNDKEELWPIWDSLPYSMTGTNVGNPPSKPADPDPQGSDELDLEKFLNLILEEDTEPTGAKSTKEIFKPWTPPKCECGAAKAGVGGHSSWCPRFVKF